MSSWAQAPLSLPLRRRPASLRRGPAPESRGARARRAPRRADGASASPAGRSSRRRAAPRAPARARRRAGTSAPLPGGCRDRRRTASWRSARPATSGRGSARRPRRSRRASCRARESPPYPGWITGSPKRSGRATSTFVYKVNPGPAKASCSQFARESPPGTRSNRAFVLALEDSQSHCALRCRRSEAGERGAFPSAGARSTPCFDRRRSPRRSPRSTRRARAPSLLRG